MTLAIDTTAIDEIQTQSEEIAQPCAPKPWVQEIFIETKETVGTAVWNIGREYTIGHCGEKIYQDKDRYGIH